MSAVRHFNQRITLSVFLLPLLILAISSASARAAATATTTTLAITSSTGAVTSTNAGTAVTFTATVKAGATLVQAGQVNFCDATAAHCTDIHVVGIAHLTTAGTAVFKFVPGPGVHSYKAEFAVTSADAASSSSASSLTVGSTPTTTTLSQTGNAGDYTLSATVTGTGTVISPTGTVSFLDASNANAVLGTATLGGASQALTWTTQSPVTAAEPNSVAVADFNGDGIPDIAVATNGTAATNGIGSVQVLLANGDGTFQAAKTYTGLSGNQLIVAAPFVNGGPEDLLVVNNATVSNDNGSAINSILFTGDGTGNFTAGTSHSAGIDSITAVITGDFNGDGKEDFIVGGSVFGVPAFNVFLGNGSGTFNSGTLNATSDAPLTALGTGDFDGQGALDIAVVHSDGTVDIFLQDGAGDFYPNAGTQAGSSPTGIAIGDFNGDGHADLAVTNSAQNSVSILLGDGTGNFNAAAAPPTGSSPIAIAVGDFNGDGIDDLAVANTGDGTVTILLGIGDGTFNPQPVLTTGTTPVSLAVGAFNGAETSDIAVANEDPTSNATNGTATVLLSQLTQTATATASNVSPLGAGTTHPVNASYAGDSIFAASTSATTSLTGSGGTETVTVAPSALTFTGQSGSTSAAQTVTLTNTGTAVVEISSVAATGNFAASSACGTTLAVGANCLISVTFAPTTAGSLTGTLTISDNATGSPQTVALSGTATNPPPTLSISPASLTFASQLVGTASAAQTVTVSNTSKYPATISSVTASAGYTVSSACGATIAANGSCALSVTFVPTAAGTITGAITLTDNATGSPQTITLSGTATIPPPTVTVTPASLTFAALAVGSSSDAQTVTLTNTGQVPVSVTSIAASGDFSGTNTCGSSVGVGANCTISVIFTPTDSGSRTGTLAITDNAGGSPQTVALTGTGTLVAIAPSASTLSINSAGGSATDTINISSAQGFSGTVNLTCAVTYQGNGSPTDPPTCSIDPSSGQVTASTALTATLTVSTTGAGSSQAAAMNPQQRPVSGQGTFGGGLLPASFSFAALLFAGFLPRRYWREMRFMVILGLSLGCAFMAIGCGGGSNNQMKGTTTGSYQVAVTAASGTATTTTTIVLTVQ
jgi:FG-GAP-like repeat/Abnormal spindle-like microcephaly-assoc'd, ASPM-SPD-2-Hydin/Bacterial Ig-like domain (group 3)/FG-GAP repeat